MVKEKNIIKSTSEYTRAYENLRGIDLSDFAKGDGGRFGYLENMYVDYEGGGRLESIPGFRKILSLGEKINAIFPKAKKDMDVILIHAGTSLYSLDIKNRDGSGEPKVIGTGLANNRSSAAVCEDYSILLDGKGFYVITYQGIFINMKDLNAGHVPTTYIDGEKFEERNLLNTSFKEKFTIRSSEEYSYATPGLRYAILDYEKKLCAVIGLSQDSSFDGELHIPSFATIRKEKFKVTEISDLAFQNNQNITKLVTNSNLVKIGRYAFSGCSNLECAVLSKTVKLIGDFSFERCEKLSSLYIGDDFQEFGDSCLAECSSLENIYYSKSEEDFYRIENKIILEEKEIFCEADYSEITLALPLGKDVSKITYVTLDEDYLEYTFESSRNRIKLYFSDKKDIVGKTVIVEGEFDEYGSDGLLYTCRVNKMNPKECLSGCTIAYEFGGCVFVAGNPKLPGIVFHSSFSGSGALIPGYFSSKSYLFDSNDKHPVKALSSKDGYLLVLKEDKNGDASVYFYALEGEGQNSKYSLQFVRKGFSSPGDMTSFMGGAVFASSKGIASVSTNKKEEPSISCLSEKISRLISAEKGESIRFAKWLGYLVVLANGRLYLADPRGKDSLVPEWYFLNGIGTHTNGRRIYKYSNKKVGNYLLSDRPDEIVEQTVYSTTNSSGAFDFYTVENGNKYSVYQTDEFRGGDFHPATELCTIGNLLFFGTDNGDICVFNNDMRGVAPPHLASMSDFDAEEYKKEMGHLIHPYYYSFDGYAVKYTMATPLDDCGIPYLEKNTTRSSLVLKLNCPARSEICVLSRTDKHSPKEICKIHAGSFDFSTADFSRFSIGTECPSTLSIGEYERGWITKQIILSSKGFRAPIGVDSLYYRYKIKGKIKNL